MNQSPKTGVSSARSSETAGHPDLMEAIAEHQDKDAFARIYEYYAPRLKAYLTRSGANGGIVDELVQEVMLTTWRRAPSYRRSQGGVSTWLYTIARNAFIDHLRREKRPMYDVDDLAFELESDENTEGRVLERENSAGLHKALDTLAPEQRDVIQLFYFGHQTHTEIAQELSLPLGTVKSRVRLAVEHLRKALDSYQ